MIEILKFQISVSVLLFCFFFSPIIHCADAIDTFVTGEWQINYIIRDPKSNLVLSQIKTNGFEQSFRSIHRGFEVKVICRMGAIQPVPSFTYQEDMIEESWDVGGILRTNLKSVHNQPGALRVLLAWLEQNVKYNESDDPQDWETVLLRGSGNCVGRSELLVKFMQRLNIHARSISGCIINGSSGQFHRWIETDYGEAGAFPTEPDVSQDFVDPYHIAVALSTNAPSNVRSLADLDVDVQKVSESKKFWLIDYMNSPNPTGAGVLRLQVGNTRYSTAVAGKIVSQMKGQAMANLEIDGKTYKTQIDEMGNFSFLGLKSAAYTLTIIPSWADVVKINDNVDPFGLKFHNIRIPDRGI